MGLEPDEFWALSIQEIEDVINARKEAHIDRLKDLLSALNTGIDVLSRNIGQILTGKVETKSVYDYYPKLFEEERAAYDAEKQKADIERHKAEMIARRMRIQGR